MSTLPPSLDRYQAELADAIRRERPTATRRLAVRGLLVAAVAITVAVTASFWPGGSGPSAAQAAAAALAGTSGTVLHSVEIETRTLRDGTVEGVRYERWDAGDAPYDSRAIRVEGASSFETATVGGTTQLYDAATNTVYEQPFDSARDKAAGGRGADPYRAKIISLLDSGELQQRGTGSVDGRSVVKLVSTDGLATLEVDARSYDPISWRVDQGQSGVIEDRFTTFERSPAGATQLSLAIVHPGARVVTGAAGFAAAMQRLAPKGTVPDRRATDEKKAALATSADAKKAAVAALTKP
jgi:hypothetical protein